MTETTKIERAITELTRSMKLAAEREEYKSAADMKRIISGLQMQCDTSFSEPDISKLQSDVHKITGNGEVMILFNKLLGVSAG